MCSSKLLGDLERSENRSVSGVTTIYRYLTAATHSLCQEMTRLLICESVEWCSTAIQWLCEDAEYLQELKHAV